MSQLNVDNIRNRTGSNGGPNFPSGISVAVGQTAYIHGNLQVDGTETIINTETLNVADKTVGIGSTSNASNTTADGSGIEVFASSSQTGNNKTLTWSNTSNSWEFGPNDVGLKVGTGVTVYGGTGIVSATSFKGDGSLLTGIDATAIQTGNTSVQTVDTGSDGHVKMTTEGGERVRVGPAGQIGLGGANYGTSGQVITSAGTGSAPTWSAIPAGGNTFTAVANGSIANDKAVKIDTDGKVSQIAISTNALTPPTTVRAGASYSSGWGGNGALAVTFIVSGTTYLWVLSAGTTIKGRVDKLNATRDNWTAEGTSFTIQGWQTYYYSTIFNSNLNKAAIFYSEDAGGQDSYCRVLYPDTTTNPDTMGSGSAQSFTGYASNKSWYLQTVWDDGINSGNGRGIHGWVNNSGGSGSAHLEYNTFTMANNNTFTFETSAGTDMNIFDTTSAVNVTEWQMCGCGSGRILVVARRQDGGATDNQTWFRMGTIDSGSNSTTWGATGSAFSSTIYNYHRICYDETSGKVIMLARADGANELLSFVGTISGSGSTLSISWGSGVQAYGSFTSMVGNGTPKYNMVYDPAQTKIMALIPDTSGTTILKTRVATISGTSVSWSTEQSVSWPGGGNNIILGRPTSVGGRVFFAQDQGSTTYSTVMKTTSDTTNLTDANHYVGYADAAYTNGQTATIKTYGNNVSSLSGLTIGTEYYVQGDGTVATTKDNINFSGMASNTPLAGTALSASKLLIRDPLAKT